MTITSSELPDWSFEAEEISASVYRAFGRDRTGRTVEAIGLDPDTLIEQCKQEALRMVVEDRESGDCS